MTQKDEGGIILLKDTTTGEVLVTDIYHDHASRERMFMSWADTGLAAFRNDKRKYIDLALLDYRTGNVDYLQTRSDKQIGFLMGNLTPDRELSLAKLYFAGKGINVLPPDEVERCIRENSEAFGRFYWKTKGLEQLLGGPNREKLMPGEYCHAERVFSLKGNFSFMGRDKIRDNADVAWIFRQLEGMGTEHVFAVMTSQDRSVVLQLGIGDIRQSVVDKQALLVAADRFQAERIWFIHNHPSGNVYASTQDITLWKTLKEVFNERLQDGVILNTDTGHYGVFNDRSKEELEFDEVQHEKLSHIPVLSFDRVVRDGKMPEKIRSSREVAETLTSLRFDEIPKLGLLVMNQNMGIVGNVFLHNDLQNSDKLIDEIVSKAMPMGVAVILYGTDIAAGLAKGLPDKIRQRSAQTLKLLDVVSTTRGSKEYISLYDEGLLDCVSEPDAPSYTSIELIDMRDGRGMLRVSRDGVFLPGEIVRRSKMARLEQGLLTKEELAARYFPEWEEEKETQQRNRRL